MNKKIFIIVFFLFPLYLFSIPNSSILPKQVETKKIEQKEDENEQKEEKKVEKEQKKTNPLTKSVLFAGGASLIFPGGGQIYNKKWIKGIIIGGMEIGGIYYTYDIFRNDSVYKEDAVWFLSFFIIYSVVDAIVDAQFRNIEVDIGE